MEDYIKLSRKILEWEWYKNINTKVVFMHLLLKANWKDRKFEGKVIPRGSFVTSASRLAAELGMSRSEVRTALTHLLQTGEITKQGTNRYTVITVVNYDLYQYIPNQSEPVPTIEDGKKKKKEKQEKKEEIYYPNDVVLNKAFCDYADMRKKIKKPLFARSTELAMSKLDKLSGGDPAIAIEILNQSILNGWQGLFPLKQDKSQEKNVYNDWGNA